VIPIFIPHKGCPFDCIFCNQRKISGYCLEPSLEQIKEIIDKHLSTIKQGTNVEIGFFGGSFTGIDEDLQIAYLETANKYVIDNKVKSIRISTRPDYITDHVLSYLKNYNVKLIELGVQSMHDDVLRASRRGHTVEDVINSAQLIKQKGIKLGVQVMAGLPESTRQKDIATAELCVSLMPDVARIYPTLVVKDTYLEKLYINGMYRPLVLKEAVDICAEMLKVFRSNNVNVIRIGLQPTEDINEKAEVVAGPFHPSFRQLVESKLVFDKISQYLINHDLNKYNIVVIATDKNNMSYVAGQKKENIIKLKEIFNLKKVIIVDEEKYRGYNDESTLIVKI